MADDASTNAITLGVADYLANQQDPVGPKLRDSLLHGVQQNPDTQAKAISDARILNQPLDVTLSQAKDAAPQAQVERINPTDLMLHTPKTADWLSQPQNAAVAHDDINVLGQIEQTFSNLGQLGKASFWGAVSGSAGALQGAAPLLSGLGVDLGDEKSGMGEALKIMRQGGKALSTADMPKTDNNWQAGINSGVVSLFQAAPSLAVALATRNPGIALGAAGAIQGGQSYGDARDAGKSRGVATAAGIIEGGIEIGTELAPVHALYADFLKKSGILTTMLHQVVPEMVGEQLATLGQNFTDWALIHPELPFSTFLSQIPDAAAQTAIATGVGIGAHASLSQVVQAATTHIDRQTVKTAQAAHAEQTGQVLDGLMKSAQTSALRERDPQTFKEYVDHITQDSPVDRVYVNAQDLVDTLAGGSAETLAQDAQVLQAMPSVIPQLDEAVKSGGLVEIPVSELLAYAPDTHLGQALVEHLKVDPEGFSMKEAETFMQSQKDSFKADVQTAMEDHGASDEYGASAERVRQTIKAQLDQANRFTPDVNEAYSHLPASFYATQAAKVGLTPEELFAQHPLTVQAQGVTEGSLTQFAGPNARSADTAALEEAKRLTSAAIPERLAQRYGSADNAKQAIAAAVYRNLGWFQGDDGKWRFEISDRDAQIKPDAGQKMADVYMAGGKDIALGDLLDHEPLYSAYPELRSTKARITSDDYGVSGLTGAIARHKITGEPVLLLHDRMLAAGYEREAKRALMHEVQHLIQGQEGFAKGASNDPAALRRMGYAGALDAEMQATGDESKAAWNVYRRAAGELEARDTEIRAPLTEQGRKEILPRPLRLRDNAYVAFHADGEPDMIQSPAELFQGTPSHFAYDPGLGFQSTLFSTVANAKQAKASGDQWLAMIQNTPGVKKEELEWIGLPEALTVMGAQGAISREQILAYIAQNGVRLEEVVQGGGITHLSEVQPDEQAQADHAEEWDATVAEKRAAEEARRNVHPEDAHAGYQATQRLNAAVDALDALHGVMVMETVERMGGLNAEPSFAEYQAIPGGENYRELLLTMPTGLHDSNYEQDEHGNLVLRNPNGPQNNPRLTRDFTAGMGHWDHDNVLAHTRLADFTTPDGKRVLGVLEIQSDWHQKGRDKGYAVAASPEEQAAAQAAFDDAIAARNHTFSTLQADYREPSAAHLADMEAKAKRLQEAHEEAGKAWDEAQRTSDAVAEREAYMRAGERFNTYNRNLQEYKAAHRGAFESGSYPISEQIIGLQRILVRTDTAFGFDVDYNDLKNAELAVREASQRVKQTRGEGGIPDAPFKATWPALVMKRLIKEAVEKGYDHIAWATGEQQADLYDMRSHIDSVVAFPASDMPDDARIELQFPGHYGIARQIADSGTGELHPDSGELLVTREQAASVLGQELGGKIYDQTMGARGEQDEAGYYPNRFRARQEFTGADLTVGGEGHKAFYNRNLVNITNDIIKKFGAKVGVVDMVNPSSAYAERFQELLDRREQLAAQVEGTKAEIKAEAERLGYTDYANEWTLLKRVGEDAHRAMDDAQAKGVMLTAHEEDAGTPATAYLEGPFADPVKTAYTFDQRLGDMQKLTLKIERELENGERDLQDVDDAIKETRTKQLGFPITDKMRAEDKAVSPPLFQAADTTARGSFNPQTSTITLLRGADLSTFLHETGHFFLETLAKLAADEHAPQEIKDDWAKASQFIGFGGVEPAAWLSIPVDARRDSHETFARGFEAYLREGRAPAPQLKGVFQRFKSWLVHVYQSAAQLNVELTPEVRGVMDRLVASQTDIAKAEQARNFAPVFDTKPDGMTDQEWEAYQRLGAEATADAEDTLQARSIRDMQWLQGQRSRLISRLTREAREKRQAVRAEVESEVAAEPIYAAQALLKRGTINGETVDGPHKLGLPELRKMYGAAPTALEEATGQKRLEVDYRRLGYGKYGMLAEEGLDPNHVAELFGFSSGDELVRTLLTAEPVKAKVEGITDQRMLERYGDLTDPQAIAKAADEAIHNDARLRFVATEASALAKAAGRTRVLAEAARDFARELIARQTIRNLKPGKYTGAEARAANASAKAFAKGDLIEAATEKRNQLINGYAAKAAYAAQEEIDKALRFFARLQSVATRKSMDADYRDQIDAMLERFDLRKGESLKAIDKRRSLALWIKSMQDKGLEPILDGDLVNEAYRKHYRDMTVEEMRGLVDAIKNIAHLGRLKNRLLMAARGRTFGEARDAMVQTVVENAYKTNKVQREFNTFGHAMKAGVVSFLTIHRKLPSLMREMGGLKDHTALWDHIVRPMNERYAWENTRKAQAANALMALYKPLLAEGDLRTKTFLPAINASLSTEGRIAVALNWGNELNRARIMDGEKWTADQATAVLQTLTATQLKFVNDMWEHLDTYWPEIAAKQRRVTGVAPEKVEAAPFQVHSADGQLVNMRGGYYPIKYETRRSDTSKAHEESAEINMTRLGLATAATTRRGHTEARTAKVERPVRYDLLVPFQHINAVLHDLAFHEYLIDANRLIKSHDFEIAVRAHYDAEVLATIKSTLTAIAIGDTPAEHGMDRMANYIRSGTTVAGLGLNMMTALMQPFGLTNSIVRVGPKFMAPAIAKCFADAVTFQNTGEWIAQKSPMMAHRTSTFMREISEVSKKVQATWKPGMWTNAEASFYAVIGRLQLVADIPTWMGAYDKALHHGEDDATAVALADQAVIDSQGSGHIGDLAQAQRGGAWLKLWTTFYSFMNVAHNQIAESFSDVRRSPANLPKLIADVALIAFIPTVLQEALKRAVRGDDWDDYWASVAKQIGGFALGSFVFLRELSSPLQSDGKQQAGPGGARILVDATKLISDAHSKATTGDWPTDTRHNTVDAASILLHVPGGQINKTLDGMEALANGTTHNPLALAFGAPHKAS